MGRLRARSSDNTQWIDICQSSWFRRSLDNTRWLPMKPSQGMHVRHGAKKYWLPIDCMLDETAVCGKDQYGGTEDGKGEMGTGPGIIPGGTGTGGYGPGGSGGSGGGGGGWDGGGGGGGGGGGWDGGGGGNGPGSGWYDDPDAGSGGGGGGSRPQDRGPYRPGYDLPDEDGDGSGLTDSGCIYRPGLNTCEKLHDDVCPTCDDDDCPGNSKPGSFACPLDCDAVADGVGAGIWEFYVKHKGEIMTMDWLTGHGGASFDVYYKGKRIATSDGRVVGTGQLSFAPDDDTDEYLFVRVRTRISTNWSVQFRCKVPEDDRGSLSNPHPCKGVFSPQLQSRHTVFFHKMGSKAGTVHIDYDMFDEPDLLEVRDLDGNVLVSTGRTVSHSGNLEFEYSPAMGPLIRVDVKSSKPGNWEYAMTCPGERGSKKNPRPCDDDSPVTSGGAGVTDTWVSFGSVPGQVGIRYQMFNIPDKLDVYQNGVIVATTGGPVTGDHWLYFDYDPARGTECCIRITGEGLTTWAFLHTCPGDNTVNVFTSDTSAKEGSAGNPGQLCWKVMLDKASDTEVEVDYQTEGGTANPLTAQGEILATDKTNMPYIASVDQEGVGRAMFDGGFPRFYNSNFTPAMTAPRGEEVFNTWPRSQGPNYWTDISSIPSGNQGRSWQLDGNGDIRCTVNSSSVLTFISPEAFEDYTFAATLYSSDSDDDVMGLVAASTMVGNTLHQIVALRQRGGVGGFSGGGSYTFALTHFVGGNVSRVLAKAAVGGTGGWSGRSTRVEVAKECNKITVRCTDWNSSEYHPGSTLEIDLTSDEVLAAIFPKMTSFGFMSYSQLGTTFRNVFLSGVGLNADFTYLKNAILWSFEKKATKTGKMLALNDLPASAQHYAMNDNPQGFAISMRGMGDACDLIPTITDVHATPNLGGGYLDQFDCLVFFGSNSDTVPRLNGASVAAISKFVSNGGGLVVVTDHDVFQATANQIAKLFNVEFYGSIDRTNMPIADIIAKHGVHPVWDGLACKTLTGGGSEGAIRLRDVRSDYRPISGTITFAPGETEKTVCAPLIGNDVIDGDRTVNLKLSNAKNAEISKDTGVGTILDDDEPLCNQNPQVIVKGVSGGPQGAQLMYVQDDLNCAPGNTWFLMQADIEFPTSGNHVFRIHSDDDYELYIDCKKVGFGPIGQHVVTTNVQAGTRTLILRYLNVPHCTPGYAGMSISDQYGSLVYTTKAVDWRGIANHVGEIIGGTPEAPPVPCGTQVATATKDSSETYTLTRTGTYTIQYATVRNGGKAPNSVDAYLGNTKVATTNGYVIVDEKKPASMTFNYTGSGSNQLRVDVGSPGGEGSFWWYKIICPD